MQGTVNWFSSPKGYGFIKREDGPDVFVHYSGILNDGYKTLNEGDAVEFEIMQGTKGPQAFDVRVTKRAAKEKVNVPAQKSNPRN